MPSSLGRVALATASLSLVVGVAVTTGATAAPVKETPSLPKSCPDAAPHVATITAGKVTKFEALNPDTEKAIAEGEVLEKGAKLLRGKTQRDVLTVAYAVTGDTATTLDFRGNDYRVSPGTFFYVTCYRKSAKGGALPMLSIRGIGAKARASVMTSAKHPGGLSAGFPGFGGPNRAVKQRIQLDVVFPKGGVPSATWDSGKTLTVTPQVGKGAGKCIYPRKVRIRYDGKVTILKR